MSDLLSERQSISSGFFRHLDDTVSYKVDSAGQDRVPISKPVKNEGRVKKLDRTNSRSQESMSVIENDPTSKLESFIDGINRKRPSGSSTSKDEGVSSTGEKEEEHDVNEDDENVSITAVETDDEGRGSWMGDKNRDDLQAGTEETPKIMQNTNDDVQTNFINLQDSAIGTIGDFDEAIKDVQETINDSKELAESNGIDLHEHKNKDLESPSENDTGESAYNGDVEDTPGNSMMGRTFIIKKMKENAKEAESKFANEAEIKEKPEKKATGSSQDVTDEAVVTKPKIKKKKKKSHSVIDLEKITANRVPISIRTTPLPVPISGKKENVNFKPRLKSKFDLQRIKKEKQKAHKKRKEISAENKIEVGSINANELEENITQPTNVSDSIDAITDVSKQGQEIERSAPVGDSFLNPLMDHTLQRPVAPHQKNRSQTEENGVAVDGNGTSAMNVSDPRTEIWVPGDDKLYVYSYSSAPRLLHVKRLGSKRVATTTIADTDPNSSFRIKTRNGRIIRGTNFGKDGAPKWNPYFAYARSLSQTDYSFYETDEIRQRREEFRKRMKERAKVRRETLGFSSVYPTPSGLNTGGIQAAFPTFGASLLHEDQNFNTPSAFRDIERSPRPCVSVGIQVSVEELESSVSSEEAIIKALVANTLRDAAVEVSAEAEIDNAKMEKLVIRRLSTMGEDSVPDEENSEIDKTETQPDEKDVREDPEGKENSPEKEKTLSFVKEIKELD